MKKRTRVVAGLMVMMLGLGTAVTVSAEEKLSGEITVWTKLTQEEIDSYIEIYNQINPNVKINAVVFPGDTYVTKLQQALRSGSGAPDVFTSEVREFGNFKNTDMLENLSSEPYNATLEEENMIEYVAELSKDDEGNFKGLSYQSCPGGFWYNKKLAKEYLGTDNPDELYAMWNSWEDIPAICAEVYEKSSGSVYLFDSLEGVASILMSRKTAPNVVDNKLYDLEFFQECMDMMVKIRENNGDTMTTMWDAPWANGMYANQNFILLGLPSWGLHYAIKANTPTDATDTDDMWGFCQAPNAYHDGGTWLSIYSGSENKEAAWDFISTMTLNTEFLTKYVDKTGDMVGYIPAIEEIIDDGFRDPYTGEQPIYEYEYEAAKNITPIAMTKYDQAIQDTFFNKMRMAAAGNMTSEEAIQSFAEDLQTQFPELVIE
ncbi:MAG: ABC transporter substrate-binding protein [Marvinbryantia sp.]|jgi:multiple sugar transport system substrate-binding protein